MMKLNLDGIESIDIVIIGYTLKKKEKIFKFNSLIQRFFDMNEALKFELEAVEELNKVDPSLIYEIYYISSNQPIQPNNEDPKVRGQRYCPYCGQTNKLVDSKGYDMCPICHCSSNDYNFRNYNDLWNKNSKSRIRKVGKK